MFYKQIDQLLVLIGTSRTREAYLPQHHPPIQPATRTHPPCHLVDGWAVITHQSSGCSSARLGFTRLGGSTTCVVSWESGIMSSCCSSFPNHCLQSCVYAPPLPMCVCHMRSISIMGTRTWPGHSLCSRRMIGQALPTSLLTLLYCCLTPHFSLLPLPHSSLYCTAASLLTVLLPYLCSQSPCLTPPTAMKYLQAIPAATPDATPAKAPAPADDDAASAPLGMTRGSSSGGSSGGMSHPDLIRSSLSGGGSGSSSGAGGGGGLPHCSSRLALAMHALHVTHTPVTIMKEPSSEGSCRLDAKKKKKKKAEAASRRVTQEEDPTWKERHVTTLW